MNLLSVRKHNDKIFLVIPTTSQKPMVVGALWPGRFLGKVLCKPLSGDAEYVLGYNQLQQKSDTSNGLTLLLAPFGEPCRVTTLYRTEKYPDTWVFTFDPPKLYPNQYKTISAIRMRLNRLGFSPDEFFRFLRDLDTDLILTYNLAAQAVNECGSQAIHRLQEYPADSSHKEQIKSFATEIATRILRMSDDSSTTLTIVRRVAHSEPGKRTGQKDS